MSILDKPFIKLFRTPNSGYFYDVGKNEIIRVPDNVFQHLSNVLDGNSILNQPNDEDTRQLIEAITELGYLSSKHPNKIQHPALATVPLFLTRCIDRVTLQLTQNCNFRCKYCIYSENKNLKQRSHSHKSMSFETAKKAIMFYRDHAVDSEVFNIGLYGGEPLLEWDLLKEIVLFAESELSGKLLTFSLTTNASLLSEPIAQFLEEHGISVLVSLDGVKEINDANRVYQNGSGTTDSVLSTIQMIREKHPNLYDKLRISSVIDPNIDTSYFGQYPCELDAISLSNFTVAIEDNTEHDVAIPFDLYQSMESEVFTAYLAKFGLYSLRPSPFGYSHVESIYDNMKNLKPTSGVQEVMAPGGPCVPGKSRLFVAADGKLYPCERVNETDAYCIGDLDNGFDYEKAKRILNIGSITEDLCKNCWAIRNCTLCGKYFDYSHNNAASEKSKFCDSVRAAVIRKMKAMILISESRSFYKDIYPDITC